MEIYSVQGALECKYVYDAWGNHKIYDSSGLEITAPSINIGNINPIRYRGYYFDKEFGLYYLQTRYYDPALGRFISPDSIDYLEPSSVDGLNLYVYCGNNPVMYTDPTGQLVGSLIAAFVIGALFGGAASAVTGIAAGKSEADLWGDIFGGAVLGAALGLATCLGGALATGALKATVGNVLGGFAFSSLGTFGAGIVSYGAKEGWQGANWDWGTALFHGGIAAAQGIASFGLGAILGKGSLWESLKPGKGFSSVVTSALNETGKGSIKAVASGVARGTMTYLQQNGGSMIWRAVFKSLCVKPIGIIRWAV